MSASRPSRRAFGKAAGAIAVLPLIAEEKEPPKDPQAASADAILALLRARYGKHLDDDQLKRLRGRLLGNLTSVQRLRTMKLANGDEPIVPCPPETP